MGGCISKAKPKPVASSTRSTVSSGQTTTTVTYASPAVNILPACEPIRLLGEGTFGTVVLVRERATKKFFAVKVMNKSHLVYEGQMDNIIIERQVLREAGPHRFVIECHSGFQTSDAVVLVLEYVSGGDMYDLLKRHGCLSEDHARFYLAEIVVALGELHKNNFVFRDLKLENILIDAQGHVRLTDFGLAGKLKLDAAGESQIFDISGTAIYQAPEMLADEGHGRVVDWWALGVLTYVLLAGRPPFSGDSREELYSNIRSESLNIANDPRLENVSEIGKSFILRLLDKNPKSRLGCASTDAEDVRNHPFFDGIDWNTVSLGLLKPPLAPGLEPNDNGTPEDVDIAEKKLAEKILLKYKPSRSTMGKLKKDIDDGEYKMVMVNRDKNNHRISIGLDFSGRNQQAAGKTWTDCVDDYGRFIQSTSE